MAAVFPLRMSRVELANGKTMCIPEVANKSITTFNYVFFFAGEGIGDLPHLAVAF